MPLHLGSTLATLFVALFSSSFEFLPPSVRALGCRWWMDPGESPGQKGVEGGGGRMGRGWEEKRYLGLCENYSKTKTRGARGCERRNDNTKVGETDGEGGLPTTSSFSYDWSNQLYPNYSGSSLMISMDPTWSIINAVINIFLQAFRLTVSPNTWRSMDLVYLAFELVSRYFSRISCETV